MSHKEIKIDHPNINRAARGPMALSKPKFTVDLFIFGKNSVN